MPVLRCAACLTASVLAQLVRTLSGNNANVEARDMVNAEMAVCFRAEWRFLPLAFRAMAC